MDRLRFRTISLSLTLSLVATPAFAGGGRGGAREEPASGGASGRREQGIGGGADRCGRGRGHRPRGRGPLDDPLTCLARSIYWETKGADVAAMEAVANVVMNRLAAEDFPDTVCGVVTEGGETGACQFSWWCDGHPDDVEEPEPYETALDVARRALNQDLEDRTEGALFFHTTDTSAAWADEMVATTTVGPHRFYRPPEDTDEDQS